MLGIYQGEYPKIVFINMALKFMTPTNDEMSKRGEIPGNSGILAFVLDVQNSRSDLSSWQVGPQGAKVWLS